MTIIIKTAAETIALNQYLIKNPEQSAGKSSLEMRTPFSEKLRVNPNPSSYN